ncbi:hypothetical protein MTYP_00648 [Methylophilaceae bacterium]|nr:hypothetical protein MTYP_00648 [Methylophilaceae bacterium]
MAMLEGEGLRYYNRHVGHLARTLMKDARGEGSFVSRESVASP